MERRKSAYRFQDGIKALSPVQNEDGSGLIMAVIVSAVIMIGAYLAIQMFEMNSKSDRQKKFAFAIENLRIHAEAILNDPASCTDAFGGQPVPTGSTEGTLTRSKHPNGEIRMLVSAGVTPIPPLIVGQDYGGIGSQPKMLRLVDTRLVLNPAGGSSTYFLELAVDKNSTVAAGLGGDKHIVRRIPMTLAAAGGTITSCSTLKDEIVDWNKLCALAGSRFDPAAQDCVKCPVPGEVIVGWPNPTSLTPQCKTLNQIVCEQMNPTHATWDAGSKNCFQCNQGYQIVQNTGGSYQCVDSVDLANIQDGLNAACPAPKQKQIYYDNGVLKLRCS